MMSTPNDKLQLRQHMRAQRRALSASQQVTLAEQLARQFAKFLPVDVQTIALYLAVDGELETQALIEHCWHQSKHVYLPIVVAPAQPLIFRQYQSDSTMTPNRYGIDEPLKGAEASADQLDVVVLPLTAFDRQGGRLGMGGGYYDRTMAQCRIKPLLVGLGYDFQELPECPMEATDQRLDWVLTPSRIMQINPA